MVRQIIRRGAATAVAVVGLEAAYAVLKPAPELDDFDPSGEFGSPENPTLRVVVMGDSSVTAPGVSGPEEIWVSIVCQRLADTGHHVVLRSVAVGGSMAHNLISDQLDDTLSFDPHLILVSVGANDVIKAVPRAVFESNLDFLIGELAKTDAVIVQSGVGVLGTIPRLHPPLSQMVSRRSRRFDDAHWRVAQKHGTAVVHQRSDDPKAWSHRELWAADQFHVSAAGHARWAETAWRTIEPLVAAVDGQR